MRRTGRGIRTVRPASSTTSRKSGAAEEAVDKADCARNGAAADNTPAIATQTADRKRGLATSFKNSPNSAISLAQQKSPTSRPGALRQRSFSRRTHTSAAREGGLAYGFSADYSGATAADSHGLPRYPCLQIEIRVYAAPRAHVNDHGGESASV